MLRIVEPNLFSTDADVPLIALSDYQKPKPKIALKIATYCRGYQLQNSAKDVY